MEMDWATSYKLNSSGYQKEVKYMNFGIKFTDICIVELIDMETGEIVAEGPWAMKKWLTAYDGNYTLTLVD